MVLVLTVRGERLSPDGPGRLLYLIHDAIWLPLYGRFWTALFPDAVIWLAIVGGLSALILIEFLGLASPLRRSQVAVLRTLLPTAPWLVLTGHRILRAVGLRADLAEQVLRDLRDDALYPFTVPAGVPTDDAAFHRLCHLQRLQLAFGVTTQRDLVAVADVLGLAALQPGARDDAAYPLRRMAATVAPESVPSWTELLSPATFPSDLPSALLATAELEAADSPPEALACRTIRIAAYLARGGDAAALVWFDKWARLRAGTDEKRSEQLSEAEALCAFEHWAACAEAATRDRPVPPILSEAFPGLHLTRPRGEVEAALVVLSDGTP
ncbi:MAG: hypothetical protein JJT81_07305 [Rubellimicrobium sp.]|nr:hypothetical protein [Rubellimicrobium sp.]